ncbi:hypothetical protein AMS68_002244 [Peltaster fructicola]|uniref:endo-1,3(4)-beta-glucanase n=1 Tax=Peltaster fructicola TaxID=286661 RepID=A0A6H0XPN6_9PEZI|nr:hypothetical protein AMS68_002244 [Peltaster fructicola]
MGASSSTVVPYVLQDDYLANGTFFNKFTFFTDSDPTHGFVQYVNQSTAASTGLITASSSNVYVGVDYKNVQPYGRPSVRLTSTKSYNAGLIILDLQHMPGGICGTWPAFWTLGDDWPNHGEIDIIEGVNEGTTNLASLHTAQGCNITKATMTGSISTSDCWVSDPNQSSNSGCAITTTNTTSYGAGFNANGGGVYATRYTASNITMWYFGRKSIPSDITAGSPDPSKWGTPVALFTGCQFSNYINGQRLVFDTTFCGDWAGNVWTSGSCASKASNCSSYVANNPADFKNAYWSINSLKVYQPTS